MAVTLAQIAAQAGVSRQTASGILNSKAHLFLPSTCKRVYDACEQLGYRPNRFAKALRSGRFNSAGLVTARDPGSGRVSPQALRSLEELLDENSMHLVIGFFQEAKSDLPRLFTELLSDGLIVSCSANVPAILEEALHSSRLPVVWMNVTRDFDAVFPDDFEAGRLATQTLIDAGHRRIAWMNLLHSDEDLLSGRLHYSVTSRMSGYLAQMRSCNLAPQTILREHNVSQAESVRGPFSWLSGKDRPTAVILHSPQAGLGSLLVHSASAGIRIPNDLSVIAFTDGEQPGDGFPIDFVEIAHSAVGRATGQMLVDKLRAPHTRLPAVAVAPVLHLQGSITPPSPLGRR